MGITPHQRIDISPIGHHPNESINQILSCKINPKARSVGSFDVIT